MKNFKNIPGAMEELGSEVRNLHFWSWHAEVIDIEEGFTDLSNVDSLRADSEAAAAWLRKYAAVSELMMTLKERGMEFRVGVDYQCDDDGDWNKWVVWEDRTAVHA